MCWNGNNRPLHVFHNVEGLYLRYTSLGKLWLYFLLQRKYINVEGRICWEQHGNVFFVPSFAKEFFIVLLLLIISHRGLAVKSYPTCSMYPKIKQDLGAYGCRYDPFSESWAQAQAHPVDGFGPELVEG